MSKLTIIEHSAVNWLFYGPVSHRLEIRVSIFRVHEYRMILKAS